MNQFSENMFKADALSAEIANIYKGLGEVTASSVGPEFRDSGRSVFDRDAKEDAAVIPLYRFAPRKR